MTEQRAEICGLTYPWQGNESVWFQSKMQEPDVIGSFLGFLLLSKWSQPWCFLGFWAWHQRLSRSK